MTKLHHLLNYLFSFFLVCLSNFLLLYLLDNLLIDNPNNHPKLILIISSSILVLASMLVIHKNKNNLHILDDNKNHKTD